MRACGVGCALRALGLACDSRPRDALACRDEPRLVRADPLQRCFLSETRFVRQRPKHGWAGYLPIASVFVGAAAGGWLAAAVGAIEWPIALVGAVVGYLVSGAILRRVYRDE